MGYKVWQYLRKYLVFATDRDYWEPEKDYSGDLNPSICELATILWNKLWKNYEKKDKDLSPILSYVSLAYFQETICLLQKNQDHHKWYEL
jgi:hypothetical protein